MGNINTRGMVVRLDADAVIPMSSSDLQFLAIEVAIGRYLHLFNDSFIWICLLAIGAVFDALV